MTCVSDDTAPKRLFSSRIVSPINRSGTGCPSLNRSGRRISKRRNLFGIGCRSFDDKRDSFTRQAAERGLRNEHPPVVPRLERKSAGEPAEATNFGRLVRK